MPCEWHDRFVHCPVPPPCLGRSSLSMVCTVAALLEDQRYSCSSTARCRCWPGGRRGGGASRGYRLRLSMRFRTFFFSFCSRRERGEKNSSWWIPLWEASGVPSQFVSCCGLMEPSSPKTCTVSSGHLPPIVGHEQTPTAI